MLLMSGVAANLLIARCQCESLIQFLIVTMVLKCIYYGCCYLWVIIGCIKEHFFVIEKDCKYKYQISLINSIAANMLIARSSYESCEDSFLK